MTELEYKEKIKLALRLLQECENAEINFDKQTAVMSAVLEVRPSFQEAEEELAWRLVLIMNELWTI